MFIDANWFVGIFVALWSVDAHLSIKAQDTYEKLSVDSVISNKVLF